MLKSLLNRLKEFWKSLTNEGDSVNRPRYPRVGGTYSIYIKDMTPQGLGRARLGSFEVFVPRTAPGDLVRVFISEVKGKQAYGHLEEIIRPSKLRSDVSCPYYRDCGYCEWDHLKYGYQLQLKREYLKKCVKSRYTGADARVRAVRDNEAYEDIFLEAEPLLDARHGYVFLSGKGSGGSGFSLEKCPRFHPVLRRILTSLLAFLSEYDIPLRDGRRKDARGLGRLYLRYFPGTEEAMLVFYIKGEVPAAIDVMAKGLAMRFPVLSCVLLKELGRDGEESGVTRLLYGRAAVYERRGRFMIEADMNLESSIQGGGKVNQKLASFVSGGGGVVYQIAEHMHEEIFWVAGAARALYVLGLEPEQRQLLEDNLITNDLYNVNLVGGEVLERIGFLEGKRRADGAVVHSRNEKLQRGVLKKLAAGGLKRVALVAESAGAMARYLGVILQSGYLLRSVIPLDTQPQRRGMRCVALLMHRDLWRQLMMKRAGAAVFALAMIGLLAFGGRGIFRQDTLIATTGEMVWEKSDFRLFLNKDVFYRYELVEARVEPGPALSGVDIKSVRVSVRRGEKKIKTVGGIVEWPLRRNPDGSFSGYWPIPYNPRLGAYVFEVCLEDKSGRQVTRSREIKLVSRKLGPLPHPLSVMTVETMRNDWYDKVPNPIGVGRGLRHIASWGRYMGVDAIWHCVGFSPAWKKNGGGNPWDQRSLDMMRKLGPEIRAQGMKYGVWLQAFAMIGGVDSRSPYQHSYAYNRREDLVEPIRHVSLADEDRIRDIAKLIKLLDKEPEVDFIGLDYIRTGLGGYELIEDFVREMGVPLSAKWPSLNMELKMKWLASQLEIEKDVVLLEKWHWWRAHKTALVVKKIMDLAQPDKPVWTFTLGWRQGKEHGQDPAMLIDAGVSCDAVMLYEATRPVFDRMNDDWSQRYLRGETLPLMVGQCVDWGLLQYTTDPPGPQELLQRNMDITENWLPYNSDLGIFWHDLSRALFGRTGPYSAKEWVIAGGASVTHLRQATGKMDLHLELMLEDEVESYQQLKLPVKLVNMGEEAFYDIEVSLLDTQSLKREEISKIKLNMIMPGEEVVIDRLFVLSKDFRARGKETDPQMIAFLINYPGKDGTRQRGFFARYIKKKSREVYEPIWSEVRGEE